MKAKTLEESIARNIAGFYPRRLRGCVIMALCHCCSEWDHEFVSSRQTQTFIHTVVT